MITKWIIIYNIIYLWFNIRYVEAKWYLNLKCLKVVLFWNVLKLFWILMLNFTNISCTYLLWQPCFGQRSFLFHSCWLAVTCLAGPLGTALCNAYETRWVVMTGGFLAGLGLMLASQATCLLHLYLTMGVISGDSTLTHLNGNNCLPCIQWHAPHWILLPTAP